MNNISVCMAVLGNPEYIQQSLHSIQEFVEEILIADIGIDDVLLQTLKKNSKVRILSIKKDVPYVELIREEMHKQAKGDYILVLDPDEIIPPKLAVTLQQSMGSYDYIKIPRKNIIFGKWIEHSRWWPDYQVRFFKKGTVTWQKKIHTQPITSGRGMELREKEELAIEHYNYKNLTEYLSKAPRYAQAEARENVAKGEPATFEHYSKKALSEFVGRYFASDGYKDGMHGFTLAFLQMMYYFLVYFYVLEERKFEKAPSENILKSFLQFLSSALYEVSYWTKMKGLSKISLIKSKLHGIVHKLS